MVTMVAVNAIHSASDIQYALGTGSGRCTKPGLGERAVLEDKINKLLTFSSQQNDDQHAQSGGSPR